MKVVLITKTDKNPTSPRLNEHFIQRLGEYKDIDFHNVEAYFHRRKRMLIPADRVKEEYNPDVVICHAHSDILHRYFQKFNKSLKVMLAVDFGKIIQNNKLDGYYKNNFDLTIHRHFLPSIKKVKTPTVWLPYSASHKEFYPQDRTLPCIGYAGTCMSPQYFERRKAIHYLDGEGMLVYNRMQRGLVRFGYANFLRKFRSILCSAEFDSPFGKLFEIMASGAVPLIPEFSGQDTLFRKDTMVHYKKDCSDIVEQAKTIIQDKGYAEGIRDRAYSDFLKYHTDDLRLNEFYNILKAAYKGKRIPRKWEI